MRRTLALTLFALIIAIDAGTTLASYGIDFVDEDDTGGGFLGLVKEVTHAAGTDTDEHFHEFGTAY